MLDDPARQEQRRRLPPLGRLIRARRNRRAGCLPAVRRRRRHHRAGHPDLRRRLAVPLITSRIHPFDSMKIVDIREETKPIKSNIRNAYIDFSKMTLSLVAVVTDVVRDGKPVVGYGFNSNGRYGQGALIRERFARACSKPTRIAARRRGDNLDPHRIWATMMTNEKPGGHGERSVAVGTIDMAVWDAVAKIDGKPLFQLLAERYGDGAPNRDVFVYAAGGYYYPGKDSTASSARCAATSIAATRW